MKTLRMNTQLFLATAMLMFTVTGCMFTPQNMNLLQSIEDPLEISGAVLSADDHVDIQYWNWLLNKWMTLEEDIQPNSSPHLAHGFTWYIWSYTRPHMIVFGMWEVEDANWQTTRLRAVMNETGEPLYTFNSWEFAPWIPLAEFWSTHGSNKFEVIIAAPY